MGHFVLSPRDVDDDDGDDDDDDDLVLYISFNIISRQR